MVKMVNSTLSVFLPKYENHNRFKFQTIDYLKEMAQVFFFTESDQNKTITDKRLNSYKYCTKVHDNNRLRCMFRYLDL